LGGASTPVQALIFPAGPNQVQDADRHPLDLQCGPNCFDLRGPGDSMAPSGPVVDRNFHMPDLIIQDTAKTVMFNTASGVRIYSTDHPQAASDASGVSFSYQAYGASVQIKQMACPEGTSNDKTTVIIGTATMGLPNMGSNTDSTGGPQITAGFTLCQDALRQVTLSLSTGNDTAIPVGSTGLFVNYVGGTVNIIPGQGGTSGYTTVKLDVGFRAFDPSVDASTVFGAGQVTIDSRGLFDLQVHAGVEVFAGIGAAGDGHFWVAWNPLDLGFETQECAPANFSSSDFPPNSKYLGTTNICQGNELFVGLFRAHMWQGQGWQHKYKWLPDDGSMHMAAEFQAKFTLAAGSILDWTFVQIPPDDISLLQIKLAFGQFCSNDPCSTYEWGVEGSFSVLGYDLGLYYGFDSGISFILGSDNHVLVDQAGGSLASALGNAPELPQASANPTAITPITITVNPGVPSAMFGLAWTGPNPGFQIVEPGPGGRFINRTSVYTDVTVTVTPTKSAQQTILVIQHPRAGTWQALIAPTAPLTKYKFFHFTNRPGPALTLSALPGGVINPAAIPITWTSDITPAAHAQISLYYEAVETPIPGANRAGGPIIEHLPLTATGSFNWVPAGLGLGYLRVFARVKNGAAGAVKRCGNQPYVPTPTLNACSTMFNPALSLARAEVDAPGILHVVDTIAPAAPQGVQARAADISSLVVRWIPNSEPDLSGYVVACHQSAFPERRVRVPAALQASSGLSETARVIGLAPAQPATCFVQAYDASYNLSSPSVTVSGQPTANVPLPPVATPFFSATVSTVSGGRGIEITWGACVSATGYLLFYEPVRPITATTLARAPALMPALIPPVAGDLTGSDQAAEGPSPINVGNVLSATLHGLRVGTSYKVWIKPYDADGRFGPPSTKLVVSLPNGVHYLQYLPMAFQ